MGKVEENIPCAGNEEHDVAVMVRRHKIFLRFGLEPLYQLPLGAFAAKVGIIGEELRRYRLLPDPQGIEFRIFSVA